MPSNETLTEFSHISHSDKTELAELGYSNIVPFKKDSAIYRAFEDMQKKCSCRRLELYLGDHAQARINVSDGRAIVISRPLLHKALLDDNEIIALLGRAIMDALPKIKFYDQMEAAMATAAISAGAAAGFAERKRSKLKIPRRLFIEETLDTVVQGGTAGGIAGGIIAHEIEGSKIPDLVPDKKPLNSAVEKLSTYNKGLEPSAARGS